MPQRVIDVPVHDTKKVQEFECEVCPATSQRDAHGYHETDAPPGWWKIEGRRDTLSPRSGTVRWVSLYFCGTNCLQAYAGWPD